MHNSPMANRKQSKLDACVESQHVTTQRDNFASAESASLAKFNAQLDQYANELRGEMKGWVDAGACDPFCAWIQGSGRKESSHAYPLYDCTRFWNECPT
eukprot:CAMPEP_0183359010 /NCGR_PEP_ID=MMETSP0164_2-20130417/50992_1 /TAXON_ID=221442 /ORGANISM="Coccolithus pelagicus ssp braarudi, Strain PLY182g" /LENGTH=98 /DNA_ID=CAMNT_0025533029 /DNA_START=116 /DNA_END=412 /DNA_ORIENTATION=-